MTGPNPPVGAGPDRELEWALEAADDRLAVAVLVQLTGETRWLDEPYRSCFEPAPGPGGLMASPAGGAEPADDDLAAARVEVRWALAAAVRQGRPAAFPDDEVLLRLVRFVTGRPDIDRSYLSYVKDALAPPDIVPVAPGDNPIPRIALIGAGICGLSMAIRLRQLGLPFRLLERHADVGGVWLENSYPRCGVDSPNHLYSFATDPNPNWSRYFARRDEIRRYLTDAVEHHGIDHHLELSTEVRSLRWSDQDRCWLLDVDRPSGSERIEADIVIPAMGTLNQPKFPTIEGIERFGGPRFHTSRWDHGVELAGRRIGMIGNGSSGFQVGPHLAEQAGHLVSFQRSPAWAAPSAKVNDLVPAQVQWLLANVPHYATWHRFVLYWSSGDAGFASLVRDPLWDGPGISAANEEVRRALSAYLRSQVGDRDDLYRKLLPDYPPFTKRMVIDNGWFSALTRPDVSLVTNEIVRATSDGLLTADGTHHELDVIIFATGFHGTRFLWPTEVRGRSGRTPAEIAGRDDDIRAYLGTAMPDFPNLFALFGPNSSIGHGGSAIHVGECQANYIADGLAKMIERRISTLEVRRGVFDNYNLGLDVDMTTMVWNEPGIASRYRNEMGRIVTNHPWTLQQFWELTRRFRLDDYIVCQHPAGSNHGGGR